MTKVGSDRFSPKVDSSIIVIPAWIRHDERRVSENSRRQPLSQRCAEVVGFG